VLVLVLVIEIENRPTEPNFPGYGSLSLSFSSIDYDYVLNATTSFSKFYARTSFSSVRIFLARQAKRRPALLASNRPRDTLARLIGRWVWVGTGYRSHPRHLIDLPCLEKRIFAYRIRYGLSSMTVSSI
jgi:hypothetical protein